MTDEDVLDRAYKICALFGKVRQGNDCIEDKSLRDVAGTIARKFRILYDEGYMDGQDNYECGCGDRYDAGYEDGLEEGISRHNRIEV
jgi:hypothetical protein